MNRRSLWLAALLWPLLAGSLVAEGRVVTPSSPDTIRIKGSDTMAAVTARWAADYQAQTPGILLETTGGGSGNGVAALINGHVEIATTSRPLKSQEVRQIVNRSGKQPVLFMVGQDALSVVVHPLNPLHGLSMQQLAGIYGREGTVRRWKDLGVTVPGCEEREIVPISRKNNSGTYYLLREDLFKRHQHFQLGLEHVHTSSAVVQRVAQTPCAIGYVGMGFVTAAVKNLCISKGSGPCVPPTAASALEKRYPMARSLYMVTVGPPSDTVKGFLQWILGPAGQETLKKAGFIPAPKEEAAKVPF
ncbi:MAG: phosphate ABC transporter substrate-binding protein [Magnetococcus sp. MYC-9]